MVPALKKSRVEAVPPQSNGNRMAAGIVAVFQQFCLNTSQHGYKYIALPDRVFAERLVWATAVAAALATSGSLVWLALQQHNSRPTLIDIETSHFPVWNFPFPAVTICPTNKVHAQRLRDLLSDWRLPNGSSRQQLWRDAAYVPALLGTHTNSPAALARLAAALSANNLTVDLFMRQVAPQCEKVVVKCQFKGLQRHCQKLFKTVLTEFGVCCSFNNRAARPSAEQRNNVDNLNEVVRMSACGRQMGLSLLIKDERNEYVTTTEASHGVKKERECATSSICSAYRNTEGWREQEFYLGSDADPRVLCGFGGYQIPQGRVLHVAWLARITGWPVGAVHGRESAQLLRTGLLLHCTASTARGQEPSNGVPSLRSCPRAHISGWGMTQLSCFKLTYFFTVHSALHAVRHSQMASQS